MTNPVNELRNRGTVIRLGSDSEDVIALRVEMPEVWDMVRIDAPSAVAVSAVKQRALEALFPGATDADDYVVKLGGYEVLNENASLGDIGVRSGSTLLLTGRRRKPVR